MNSEKRIDQFHAAIGKIAQIACGDRCTVQTGDCRDLTIELPDWLASLSSPCRDHRENVAGISIERQHATGELVFKHRCSSVAKCVALSPARHDFQTKVNLGLCNRCGENLRMGMEASHFVTRTAGEDFITAETAFVSRTITRQT